MMDEGTFNVINYALSAGQRRYFPQLECVYHHIIL